MMAVRRGILLAFIVTAMTAVFVVPCSAEEASEEKEQDIWTEDEHRGPPRRGPGRFELSDEEIDRVMKSLRQKDPAKADELARLRKEKPDEFRFALGRHGGEELRRIMRERAEAWWNRIRTEFLEWLAKNYRREAEELARLKETDPDLYMKKFNIVRDKYWRIFEEERRNPELAAVLKEDLALKERRETLCRRLKAATSEREKKRLAAHLEEVVGRRYDLIVRRKEIAYERLLRWLEELTNRIKKSRAEIAESKDPEVKAENVKRRMKELTEGISKFEWD
jgi:gas vesicle protein